VRSLDPARRAAEVAQQRLGAEHPDTLDARANLAIAYRETGRPAEAVELGQQVLADSERVLGPEDPHTLEIRASLARSSDAAPDQGA
jgi:cytochrome c-type biogenesis protein CcmH/NrfG